MSMLEKMARQLATDALERVKPGTYTSVVDGIGLYQMLDGNYQVGECLGAGDEDAPGISYDTAREAMVAMMAGQAGALVVVPEDAPMDSHLVQIAQMLVDSADVPTDASDVADGAAIVGTVKNALDWLATTRDDNGLKRATILEMGEHLNAINAMLDESPDIGITEDDLQVWSQTVDGVRKTLRYLGEVRREAIELRKQNVALTAGAKRDAEISAGNLREVMEENDRIGKQCYVAQQKVDDLSASLDAARRKNDQFAVELGESIARYEGVLDAFRLALDKLAGVGK